MTYQNFLDTAKLIIRGQFTSLEVYLKKQEKSQRRTQARKSQIFHSAIFSLICHTDMSSRVMDIKETINKQYFNKIKSFCTAKEKISKMKREPTVWENILANDTSGKGLISKIYKELTQLHSRKTKSPINKWAKDLNRHFSKEDTQRPTDI